MPPRVRPDRVSAGRRSSGTATRTPRQLGRGRSAGAPGPAPGRWRRRARSAAAGPPPAGTPARPARTTSWRPRRRPRRRPRPAPGARRATGALRRRARTARVRLPASVSGGDVAQVVDDEDRAGQRADADGGVQRGPLPRLGLDVRRADHRDQAEEDEDHHLAERRGSRRASCRRCRTTRPGSTTTPTATSHHAVVAASTSPATAATPKARNAARLTARGVAQPRADQPHRADPVVVGAADAVGVVVGVVDADLERQRRPRGRAAPSTTRPRRRTPRRRCRRARGRRRRAGCAGPGAGEPLRRTEAGRHRRIQAGAGEG